MTDPTLPPLSDDDLSAALDGQVTPDVQARIDADPAARVRLEQLRSAARLIGAEPVAPLPAATVDDLIGRALAAADDPATGDPAGSGPAGDVVFLAPPTSGRRGVPTWLVAAAVVVLVLAGLGLVFTGRDTGGDAAFEQVGASINDSGSGGGSAESTADETESSAEEPPPHGARPGSSANPNDSADAPDGDGATPDPSTPDDPTRSADQPLDLGTFASADDLREALATALPTTPVGASAYADGDAPTDEAVERCGTQMQTVLDLDDAARATGFALVDGEPVIVYEYETDALDDGTPTTLVAAVGPASCDEVVIFQR